MKSDESDKLRFGPYELVRELVPTPLAERWLALHERDHSSHVVYRFPARHERGGQRRFLSAVEGLAALHDSHLLEIEQFSICAAGRGVLVTPFTGNHDGLVTLGTLVDLKGGRMSSHEADRAITHILEGLVTAHAAPGVGACHGVLSIEEILVDRHGRVLIELYGLASRLRGAEAPGREAARDEIRSVAAIAYRLLTGLPATDPLISMSRLVKGLNPQWLAWMDRAMNAAEGFATAAQAIEELPSNSRDVPDDEARGAVRTVLSKFRWPSRLK